MSSPCSPSTCVVNAPDQTLAPFLATELVTYIFELAISHPDPTKMNNDAVTLRSCSLVCKHWEPIAQRLLFHRVATRNNAFSQASIASLDRFLAQQRDIGTRILSLDFAVRISPADSKLRPGTPCHPVSTLERILSHCPHLYNLCLHTNIPNFEDDKVARLAALPVKIRSLDAVFHCAIENSIAQLSAIWPIIRHFRYQVQTRVRLRDPPIVRPQRPPFALYDLVLHADLDVSVLD